MAVILVLDRDPIVRDFLVTAFPSKYCFLPCQDWSEALPKLRNLQLDLVLVDLAFIESYGHELIERIRARQKCKVLLFAASRSNLMLRWTMQSGADGYLQKILDAELTLGLLLPFIKQEPKKRRPSRLFRKPKVESLRINLGETTKYRPENVGTETRSRSTPELDKTTRLNLKNFSSN